MGSEMYGIGVFWMSGMAWSLHLCTDVSLHVNCMLPVRDGYC